MKYFMDLEFIEGFHKPLFGKRRHFIDLISIGIVAEDGREYYAISNEFNEKDTDDWVKENVIAKLECVIPENDDVFEHSVYGMDAVRACGKSNKQIAEDIINFVYSYGDCRNNPEFYAYYADYDWVLLCSLFGRMINLPRGFPMYCIDLKQMLDDVAMRNSDTNRIGSDRLEDRLKWVKAMPEYPAQTNEHHALADARWNYELYKFLQGR